VLEKNPATVKVVYKNFPLRSHKMALPAAKAAQAGAKQGRFWEFHDKIFTTKNLDNAKISQIAIDLGLDMARYTTDMNSPETQKLINRDLQEGQQAGVRGTPTLFVNGHRVQDRSPAGLQNMIDREIKKLKK